ncbi:P cell-type agglutination protein [Dirofilaria immitis]
MFHSVPDISITMTLTCPNAGGSRPRCHNQNSNKNNYRTLVFNFDMYPS